MSEGQGARLSDGELASIRKYLTRVYTDVTEENAVYVEAGRK